MVLLIQNGRVSLHVLVKAHVEVERVAFAWEVVEIEKLDLLGVKL